MFPLKTLVVAVILAMLFGPRVNACPAHNHEQVVEAPAAAEATQTAVAVPTAEPAPVLPAQPAEVAAAEQSAKPTAN
jgi:hypothetical protein